MEQIKANHSGGANFEARTVKDIIEPTKSIFNKISVKAALDEMQARAIDSSPVIANAANYWVPCRRTK